MLKETQPNQTRCQTLNPITLLQVQLTQHCPNGSFDYLNITLSLAVSFWILHADPHQLNTKFVTFLLHNTTKLTSTVTSQFQRQTKSTKQLRVQHCPYFITTFWFHRKNFNPLRKWIHAKKSMFIALRWFWQHRQIVNTPTLKRFVELVCWFQRQHTRFLFQLFTMYTLLNCHNAIFNHTRPIKHTTNHMVQLHNANMTARGVHFIKHRPTLPRAQHFSQVTTINFKQLITNQLKLFCNIHQGCILVITELTNQFRPINVIQHL